MNSRLIIIAACTAAMLVSCKPAETGTSIVAHRGFWNCEQAGYSENSIASLKAAQDCGFRGSEFDVQLTKDEILIVNHNNDIDGLEISEHYWHELEGLLLPNGERRPLLEEYLAQGAKSDKTLLVMELKSQKTSAQEDVLVEKSIQALKDFGMFKPDRVAFISFSYYMCKQLAEKAPGFKNQYLNGDKTPAEVNSDGINGIDYEQGIFANHPEWIEEAHALNMDVNVWTVNNADAASKFIEAGVDAVTTNEPLMVRDLLGKKENRK